MPPGSRKSSTARATTGDVSEVRLALPARGFQSARGGRGSVACKVSHARRYATQDEAFGPERHARLRPHLAVAGQPRGLGLPVRGVGEPKALFALPARENCVLPAVL